MAPRFERYTEVVTTQRVHETATSSSPAWMVLLGATALTVVASILDDRSRARAANRVAASRAVIALDDSGTVKYQTPSGEPLPEAVIKLVQRTRHGEISDLLERECKRRNTASAAIATIHLATPPPDAKRRFEPRQFPVPPPAAPRFMLLRRVARVLRQACRQAKSAGGGVLERYEANFAEWQQARERLAVEEARRRDLWEHIDLGTVDQTRDLLEAELKAIDWPRETRVTFHIASSGTEVLLDVDLPEIEDLPLQHVQPDKKAERLISATLSDRERRDAYSVHVHGIVLRLLGEVFSLLPKVHIVVVSGYSQRSRRGRGRNDEYLISVRASRDEWKRISLDPLTDPRATLRALELRCKVSLLGELKEIEPFAPSAAAIGH